MTELTDNERRVLAAALMGQQRRRLADPLVVGAEAMTDEDYLTTLDRAILAAVSFGGGITVGYPPDEGGWIRGKGLVFRGVNVTEDVARLIILINCRSVGYRDLLKPLRELMKQLDPSPFIVL